MKNSRFRRFQLPLPLPYTRLVIFIASNIFYCLRFRFHSFHVYRFRFRFQKNSRFWRFRIQLPLPLPHHWLRRCDYKRVCPMVVYTASFSSETRFSVGAALFRTSDTLDRRGKQARSKKYAVRGALVIVTDPSLVKIASSLGWPLLI